MGPQRSRRADRRLPVPGRRGNRSSTPRRALTSKPTSSGPTGPFGARARDSAAERFGAGGRLASLLGTYEDRPGQAALAAAVERTLAEDRVLFCEAGTGTGKTLAYLVPALACGRKVVVSTATRALQDQIVAHDLPLALSALSMDVPVAIVKGLSNYLCRRRLAEAVAGGGGSRGALLSRVEAWAEATETGDLAELGGVPEDDPLLARVSSSSETRLGASCAHHDACFVTRTRRLAEEARLVIVNHHLFFADLALRGAHPARVLPEYDAVVFDEAHKLEDVATTFFATKVSTARVQAVLGDAHRALSRADLADPLFGGGGRLVEAAEACSKRLFTALTEAVSAEDGRGAVDAETWQGPAGPAYLALDSALESLAGFCAEGAHRACGRSGGGAIVDSLEQLARRLARLRDDLAEIVDGASGRVAWLERTARSAALTSAPVDVSRVFRERVFESIPAVVLTSATLTSTPTAARAAGGSGAPAEPAGPTFQYLRRRLGVEDEGVLVDELVVASPFDFRRNALLYVPRDLPRPGDAQFVAAAIERILALVGVTDGGAFVLTTSLRSLRAMHRALSARAPDRTVLGQGAASKRELLARFRADPRAVLVATSSFWEGVDVVGRGLRLVVLEKVPFPVPTDPLARARAALLEREGRSAFEEHQVPAAAILLKQGFGRLIRSRDDRGIVAVLDGRLHERGYGPGLLATLPPARRVDDLSELRALWVAMAGSGPPESPSPL